MKIAIRPETREVAASIAALAGLMIVIGTTIVIGWWMLLQAFGWAILVGGVTFGFYAPNSVQGEATFDDEPPAGDLPVIDNPWQA